MKISIDDIRDRYEKGWLWTYYVRRPISFYLAKFFLIFNISANKVTVSFLIIGVIGSLLFAAGDYSMFIIGALIIELAIILDCVDGSIARVKGSTTLGRMLDIWSGKIVLALSAYMLGIGLSKMDNLTTISILKIIMPSINNDIFIYIGSLVMFVILFAGFARYSWRVLSKNIEDLKAVPNKNVVIRGIENIFGYSGAYPITLLIAAVLNMLDIFLILMAVIYSTSLFVVLYIIIKKGRLLDD